MTKRRGVTLCEVAAPAQAADGDEPSSRLSPPLEKSSRDLPLAVAEKCPVNGTLSDEELEALNREFCRSPSAVCASDNAKSPTEITEEFQDGNGGLRGWCLLIAP
jgi:hypothetical protein